MFSFFPSGPSFFSLSFQKSRLPLVEVSRFGVFEVFSGLWIILQVVTSGEGGPLVFYGSWVDNLLGILLPPPPIGSFLVLLSRTSSHHSPPFFVAYFPTLPFFC